MRIEKIKSWVLSYDMESELGYSQAYYDKRTAHLVEISTDEGLTGWGECFGPGAVAVANKVIVEQVIAPLITGMNPLDREVIWHKVYNALRDHGQKGMPIQALSSIDIALWDLFGKIANLPLCELIGGAFRESVPVYGYGMMLKRESVKDHCARFIDESRKIKDAGFIATKMKIGLGAKDDIKLAESVRKGVGDDFPFMADANHAYAFKEAFLVGQALDELNAAWFEEPVAPEDRDGYRNLRAKLKTPIAGGEAEFTRWGWRDLLAGATCLDIAQPEVCALGGISEYLKVLALCHSKFVPVVNHVWGSGLAVAANLHLLAAMPPLPGAMFAEEPWLEFDTTPNKFRDEILEKPLEIQKQVAKEGGRVKIPQGAGLGVQPNREFIEFYEIGGGKNG